MSATVTRPTPTTAVKFHFSLWVADLGRTVAFYRALFGQEPHKHYADYAKFELADPPVVLSFLQSAAPGGASLNHAGLRLPTSAGLVAVQSRLEGAGYPTEREDGVECCYALQTKFWVADPDGVRWEVYTVHDDIDHHGHQPPAARKPAAEIRPAGGAWVLTMADSFPERIPHADASLDDVRLKFTFNTESFRRDVDRNLSELARVLKPGGRITAQSLVGDRVHPTGTMDIPGLMNKVRHVFPQAEPLEMLARAGFQEIEISNWKEVCCVDDGSGVGFRAVTVTAKRGPRTESTAPRFVRYVGEFRQAIDDDGTAYPRGVRVAVTETAWNRLKSGSAAGQFEFSQDG
jgi:catechol 2,3-dioxygenase-like lactoylglutathione lyase family enzyme